MKIINSAEFDSYWKNTSAAEDDEKTIAAVKEIIAGVRAEGDAALRHFAYKFDKSSPRQFEVPLPELKQAYQKLRANDPVLTEALKLAARHIMSFSQKQKEQFADFEYEMEKGLFTGQRVIPVDRAAIYVPAGRFPLISSVLMGIIPAICAGVEEIFLASPPLEDGFPDRRIMAAAIIAAETAGKDSGIRVFAIGGAQAVAALALGTESIPKADIIAGPGNKYVAAAKRLLFGEVGIDFIAGPTDVLVIADNSAASAVSVPDVSEPDGADFAAADLVAADMIAQAEHDPDARARALVPSMDMAEQIVLSLNRQLQSLPSAETARSSLQNGGLIIIYQSKEEAIRIANTIAPEHLELQTTNTDDWIPKLKNYGSLFIGSSSAEALGDYSAGLNHTLPTSGSARFSSGLSVRHFLKTATTLRCTPGPGFEQALQAAQCIARAEGLEGHARSAAIRAKR